jgi:S-adenosyl methyltransferase
MTDDRTLPQIDTTRAHPARIYDAWLGGKDNITQVVSGNPYNCRTVPIQARHDGYSKTGPLAVL